VLVKNLTIGCTSGLRLVQRWEGRFFYPTVMPCWLNNPRAICEYTRFIRFVKPCPKIILGPAVGIGGILKNPIKPWNFSRKSQGRLSVAPRSLQGIPRIETRGEDIGIKLLVASRVQVWRYCRYQTLSKVRSAAFRKASGGPIKATSLP
jgi:hypothetical protein